MIAQLKNISKHYKNNTNQSREVLESIDFSLIKGDSIAIVGPSGSGKSTLLNILGTLDSPTAGEVIINGREIKGLKINELAQLRNEQIGFVFQQHYLLPQLSLIENILVPLIPVKKNELHEKARARAVSLLEQVGLSDKLNRKPSELSVGECQRGAVVRALVNEPKLLLADEPTGSLDEKSAESLVHLLVQLNKEQHITLVMVTHSSHLASKLNKQYNLSNGKLKIVTK